MPTAKVPVVLIAPLPETVSPGLVTAVTKLAVPMAPVTLSWLVKLLELATGIEPVVGEAWVIVEAPTVRA